MTNSAKFLPSIVAALAITLAPAFAQDAPAEVPEFSADQGDEILNHEGRDVVVFGRVENIGRSRDGGITFINFGRGRGGFVAVVFSANYDQFPDGIEAYHGKNVRVTGTVTAFQGTTPQIELNSPGQIEIVE